MFLHINDAMSMRTNKSENCATPFVVQIWYSRGSILVVVLAVVLAECIRVWTVFSIIVRRDKMNSTKRNV